MPLERDDVTEQLRLLEERLNKSMDLRMNTILQAITANMSSGAHRVVSSAREEDNSGTKDDAEQLQYTAIKFPLLGRPLAQATVGAGAALNGSPAPPRSGQRRSVGVVMSPAALEHEPGISGSAAVRTSIAELFAESKEEDANFRKHHRKKRQSGNNIVVPTDDGEHATNSPVSQTTENKPDEDTAARARWHALSHSLPRFFAKKREASRAQPRDTSARGVPPAQRQRRRSSIQADALARETTNLDVVLATMSPHGSGDAPHLLVGPASRRQSAVHDALNLPRFQNGVAISTTAETSLLRRPVPMAALVEMLEDAEIEHRNFIFRAGEPPFVFILPGSTALNVWSLTILTLVLVQSVTLPLDTCFELEIFGDIGETLVTILFLMDFGLNFIYPFSDEDGNLVYKFRQIAERYVCSIWFLVDVLSIFPFELVASNTQYTQQTKTIKMFKLMRMVRLGKVARPSIRNAKMAKTGVHLMKLLLVVLLLMHWITCGWNLVGVDWRCGGLPLLDVVDEGDGVEACPTPLFWPLYTSCLFQACRSLFGDGEAFTVSEKFYFAVVVLIGAIMQASVFGSVANLLRSFDEDRHAFEHKLEMVRHKMEFLLVPERLQDRVLAYYEKQWQFHKSLGEKSATAFINELSRPLQMDLKIDLFKDLLAHVPFLQAVDTAIAEELVLRLDTQTFMKGDAVIRKGDPSDWMGFVSRGIVAVLDPRISAHSGKRRRKSDSDGVVIRVLRQGSHFGELGILSDSSRTCSLGALSWVQVEVITHAHWSEMQDLYPAEMAFCQQEISRHVSKVDYIFEDNETPTGEQDNADRSWPRSKAVLDRRGDDANQNQIGGSVPMNGQAGLDVEVSAETTVASTVGWPPKTNDGSEELKGASFGMPHDRQTSGVRRNLGGLIDTEGDDDEGDDDLCDVAGLGMSLFDGQSPLV
jgi:CRP-like cAMP-binding protein